MRDIGKSLIIKNTASKENFIIFFKCEIQIIFKHLRIGNINEDI